MKILGIETSCDETAAAVVEVVETASAGGAPLGAESGRRLLSNVVASSMDLHVQYGGVVPEIAARSHIEVIMPVIQQALAESGSSWDDIDAIGVTYGAGLGGSLLIGVMTARTLAIALGKPLYAINHVEAHVYANFLTESVVPLTPAAGPPLPRQTFGRPQAVGSLLTETTMPARKVAVLPSVPSENPAILSLRAAAPAFPMLAVIVSGGHSQLVLFRGHFDYTLLGQTQDDAIGEAFDKVAKMLGLPYPGGPSVAAAALEGNPLAFQLPKAKMGKYDFSFSGPKTAVLRLAQAQIGESYDFPSWKLSGRLSVAQKADIAASFQRVACETIVDKARLAYAEFAPASVVIAGGVAANQELRRQLTEALSSPPSSPADSSLPSPTASALTPLSLTYPNPALCTDNAAMVACLTSYKVQLGQPTADPYTLVIEPNLSM